MGSSQLPSLHAFLSPSPTRGNVAHYPLAPHQCPQGPASTPTPRCAPAPEWTHLYLLQAATPGPKQLPVAADPNTDILTAPVVGGGKLSAGPRAGRGGPSRECPPLGMLMSSGDSSVLTRGRQDTLCQVSLFRPRTGWPGKPGGAYPSCRLGRHIILSVPSSITGSTYITLCLQEIMI